MLHPGRLSWPLAAATVVFLSAASAFAQATAEPNSQPNPYRTVENWAKLPEGRAFGSNSGIDIDKGGNVWVAERCGANSCAGKTEPPICQFDPSGKMLKCFGEGLFVFPHGLTVDKDGNIWVTDGQGKDDKGHQVFKFSPDGKILMTLGKAGVAGDGPDTFNQPNAVAVAPNGDIFVSDGHGIGRGNARVSKFTKDGKFIKQWGGHGSGPGQFEMPHAMAFDSKGRLFVADRGNNRIQIFDQDGKFLEEWKQFSRPSGVFIDAQDNIYVADSESGSVARARTDWKRGIRIGSAKDGSVKYYIPDPAVDATGTSSAEGIAVDPSGHIYGAEVGPPVYGATPHLKRYTKP